MTLLYIGLSLAAVAVGWALVDEFWPSRRRRRVATAAMQPGGTDIDRYFAEARRLFAEGAHLEMSAREVDAEFERIGAALGPPFVWPNN